jgi:hypothetical protein
MGAMEFVLTYEGRLPANGNAEIKQQLRRHFHKQLSELWHQKPLAEFGFFVEETKGHEESLLKRSVGSFDIVPFICEKLNLVAELEITFLRPEEPGNLITQGGDIDNRLKTLFDGLRMPKNQGELSTNPSLNQPAADETPFYCLLEDDNLITKLRVDTHRLLKSGADPSEVLLLIRVVTRTTRSTWNNLAFA